MSTSPKTALATVLTAAATLIVSLALPAVADTATDERKPLASMRMVMYDVGATPTPVESDLSTKAPVLSKATLECTPDGGTHPTPGDACDSLRAVGGNFDQLPTAPETYCIALYDPVTVVVKGHWQSSPMGPVRPIDFKRTYSNSCQAAVQSDHVFAF
ncbi:SSI family serine proteinase inhibitor [Salinactinospora qingdaonensis]